MTTSTLPDRVQDREPYVGVAADGARRSAEIDRTEAEGLDPVHDAALITDLLDSAVRWDAQAKLLDVLEADVFDVVVKHPDREALHYPGLTLGEHEALRSAFSTAPLATLHVTTRSGS